MTFRCACCREAHAGTRRRCQARRAEGGAQGMQSAVAIPWSSSCRCCRAEAAKEIATTLLFPGHSLGLPPGHSISLHLPAPSHLAGQLERHLHLPPAHPHHVDSAHLRVSKHAQAAHMVALRACACGTACARLRAKIRRTQDRGSQVHEREQPFAQQAREPHARHVHLMCASFVFRACHAGCCGRGWATRPVSQQAG